MVAGNGAAGFYLTKEQRPTELAEAAAVSGSESGRCVPASLCCPLSITNPRVGGAWSGHSFFWPHPTWHTCSRALQKAYTHAHTHSNALSLEISHACTQLFSGWQGICLNLHLLRHLGTSWSHPLPCNSNPWECADSARWPVPPTTDTRPFHISHHYLPILSWQPGVMTH